MTQQILKPTATADVPKHDTFKKQPLEVIYYEFEVDAELTKLFQDEATELIAQVSQSWLCR